jgi:hypothetical protein
MLSFVLPRNATACELAIEGVGSRGEKGNGSGNSGGHEIGRLQYPCFAGVDSDDDHIGWLNGIFGDERPPGRAKESRPTGDQRHQNQANRGDCRQPAYMSFSGSHCQMIPTSAVFSPRLLVINSTLVLHKGDFWAAGELCHPFRVPEICAEPRLLGFFSHPSHGQFFAT